MKIIYFTVFCLSIIVLLANRNGRAATNGSGATTAPGESGQTCGSIGCHFNGPFAPEAALQLLDRDSLPVNSYEPGKNYIIRLSAQHGGTPAGYGFQLVTLRSSDNSGLAGYMNFPERIRGISIGDRTYVEHSNILEAKPIYLDWESPVQGTGRIDIYAAINVVNGNGSSSGDGADTTSLSITEEMLSSTSSTAFENQIQLSPNPASEWFTILSEESLNRVTLKNMSGQSVLDIPSIPGTKVDVSGLQSGLYILHCENADGVFCTKKILIH